MTFLEAYLIKWSEKQPSCSGLRRGWETTLEAMSGDCPMKKSEIREIDNNCSRVVKEGRILFYLGWGKAFIGC